MTTQPEALRLADALRTFPSNKTMIDLMDDASSELRRQHSRIKELEAAHETAYSSGMVEGERICIKRIAELEASLDVALEALESADWYIGQLEPFVYTEPDDGVHEEHEKVRAAIAKLKEVRK